MLMSACVNVILLTKTWIDDKQSRKSNQNDSFLFIHICICNSIEYLYSKKNCSQIPLNMKHRCLCSRESRISMKSVPHIGRINSFKPGTA